MKEMMMAPKDSEIAQIVATIWQSVLGIECQPTTDLPGASTGTMLGCVHITGAWQGAVVLGCPKAFAARAATIMFNTPDQECNVTDMQDAIAELTNMIGGNLKALLTDAEACQLSLPSVVAGSDYITRIPGSRPINRIAIECGDHVIVINVLEKLAEACAA
jgi:CheY-specific phosphatase CheX